MGYSKEMDLLRLPGSPDGAFAVGAGGAFKLGRACSLSSSTGRMKASGNPFFRAPWLPAAFPSVPLKALMAPGLLLSFGYEEEPFPRASEEVVVSAKHPASIWKTINMDGGLTRQDGNMTVEG
ncbi:hypothetical protein A6R68_15209 [Neotoma lepida]|uniref:Uncharacterized protein n=1 Tax=Neotoma lepida TaxID=56216 RepID=A0A1A6H6L4_NEOLE|nr:hypothetical protein A6R68_15209 [Neotoma lepida]